MNWRRLLHRAALIAAAGVALMVSGIEDAHAFGPTLALLVGAYVIARAVRNK